VLDLYSGHGSHGLIITETLKDMEFHISGVGRCAREGNARKKSKVNVNLLSLDMNVPVQGVGPSFLCDITSWDDECIHILKNKYPERKVSLLWKKSSSFNS